MLGKGGVGVAMSHKYVSVRKLGGLLGFHCLKFLPSGSGKVYLQDQGYRDALGYDTQHAYDHYAQCTLHGRYTLALRELHNGYVGLEDGEFKISMNRLGSLNLANGTKAIGLLGRLDSTVWYKDHVNCSGRV